MLEDENLSCFHEACKNNLWSISCFADLTRRLKPLIGFISIESKFDGISSLTYNHTSPYIDSKLNLHGELTPSIYKFPRGKLSSVSVSEIIRIFMFPLIWAEVVQTNESYIQMGKNQLNSSLIKAEILATQCKLKTSDICFKKPHLGLSTIFALDGV